MVRNCGCSYCLYFARKPHGYNEEPPLTLDEVLGRVDQKLVVYRAASSLSKTTDIENLLGLLK